MLSECDLKVKVPSTVPSKKMQNLFDAFDSDPKGAVGSRIKDHWVIKPTLDTKC